MSIYADEKKNVAILVISQLLFMVATITVTTLSGVIGQELSPNPNLATLPISLMMIGSLLTTLPASLYMKRVGRRRGFITGAAVGGVGGAALSVYAIASASFLLFCLGNMLIGFYQGFAMYYRFAAADVASPTFRTRAMSFVMAAGLVAAFLGPWNASSMVQLIPSLPNAGPFVMIMVFTALALLLLSQLRVPAPGEPQPSDTERPIKTIVRQPTFLVALLSGTVGYTVMALVMTATPLALRARGYDMGDVAFIIQWHVLGMFAPSFFTGSLINRFGVDRVVLAGVVVFIGSIAIAVAGETLTHFWFSLVLLGVGWNFLFISGSALVATTHTEAERGKVQGANDLIVFSFSAAGSLLAGSLLHSLGWATLNLAMLPAIVLVAVVTWSWQFKRRRHSRVSENH
ncbi:MFS transporter [Aliidiomarina taiwanensis]|uniref:MFS transporter n=1 Tax=Aliidiomarina taiwanensis TaxID=946228 RepID=A0A432X0W3_9GAMM|nr:MFS transporter [Aliidiomarina taiwanensis]RUO39846.1 MFS transporter [Aliidiomarina taiwanensis]